MDFELFLKQYQDHLAPRLEPLEQAIYLYAVRHSRAIGQPQVTIGFNAASQRGAFGKGRGGAGMKPQNCRKKVRSLATKGLLTIESSEHDGFRLTVRLPSEVPDVVPAETSPEALDVESIDFFKVQENRLLILQRDGMKCFYCLRAVNANTYVLEHVEGETEGGNGYRNLVAACRDCNNRKGSQPPTDLLRALYRSGLLDQGEFDARVKALEDLRAGRLRPDFSRAVAARP